MKVLKVLGVLNYQLKHDWKHSLFFWHSRPLPEFQTPSKCPAISLVTFHSAPSHLFLCAWVRIKLKNNLFENQFQRFK